MIILLLVHRCCASVFKKKFCHLNKNNLCLKSEAFKSTITKDQFSVYKNNVTDFLKLFKSLMLNNTAFI